jgi:hypothetical protein
LFGEGFLTDTPTTDAADRIGRIVGNVVGLAVFAMMAWVVLRGIV